MIDIQKVLTKEYLDTLLNYDPITGELSWKIAKSNAIKPGKILQYNKNVGYVLVIIDKKQYLAHQIIWILMTGELPNKIVDHIDNNPQNNKWDNLRLATKGENAYNSKIRVDNTTGVKGVYFCTKYKRYIGQIKKNGIRYKAHFVSLTEAKVWINNKRAELHGEFTNHG